MKCKRQRRNYKLAIESLWEVHLESDLWDRIKKAAEREGCSFSWITRYCVFRLARKKNLFMRQAMKIHSNKVKSIFKSNPKYHRHAMCLYGDDEKLLRLAAMQLGVTISHLIRISLHWFLPKIENRVAKWHHIFYHGTKICRFLSFTRTNMLRMPYYETLFYEKWSQDQWWKRPATTIQIPYTPILKQQDQEMM